MMPTLLAGCGGGSSYEGIGHLITVIVVLGGLVCLGALMAIAGAGLMVCTRTRDFGEKQPRSFRIGKRIMIVGSGTLVVLVGFPTILISLLWISAKYISF